MMEWGYAVLFTLFIFFILQLCCELYVPLMVAVLCELMCPYRRYFMQYDDHGIVRTT